MKSHTVYKTFRTVGRREFVRIAEDVQQAVDESGIREGMALVAAMHITAGVWINDDEPGLQADVLEWLDKLAPRQAPHHQGTWRIAARNGAREGESFRATIGDFEGERHERHRQ